MSRKSSTDVRSKDTKYMVSFSYKSNDVLLVMV